MTVSTPRLFFLFLGNVLFDNEMLRFLFLSFIAVTADTPVYPLFSPFHDIQVNFFVVCGK